MENIGWNAQRLPMISPLNRQRPAPTRLAFDAAQRRRHKQRNILHSALLLGGMAALVYLSAWSLWGGGVALWAMAGGLLGFAVSPKMAPEWVMHAYRAVRLDRSTFPEAIELVDRLSRRAGLGNPPRLYLLPSTTLNAFAVGNRQHAAVAITSGLLQRLDWREFAGVLAHEISHVRNNDLWLMGLADMMSRLTSLMATLGVFLGLASLPLLLLGQQLVPPATVLILVLAPLIGSLLQLALSRARELDADLEAATLTGDPAGLASALQKLDRYQGRHWEEILLPGRRMREPSLLRTHPPTAERVGRLLSLYGEAASPILPTSRPTEALPGTLLRPCGRPRFRAWGYWY
jgi:heat shock protein HtpX